MTGEEPSWKDRLREQFESVLAGLDEPPMTESAEDEEPAPDIYTFYEALATLRHEIRLGNRKTADALSRFGDSLGAFDAALAQFGEDDGESASNGEDANGATDGGLGESLLLPLIEFADRIERLDRSFREEPAPSGWLTERATSSWRIAWKERAAAVTMLLDQVQALLASAGLKPIPTENRPFDPMLMTAVAREEDAEAGNGELVVVEEITSGFFYHDNIVRLAEVRVGRRNESPSENQNHE